MFLRKQNRFRTSFTSQEGFVPATVVQCRVIDVNITSWTVDCVSQFDRKRYFNIQVGAPYLHYSNGEGLYIVPEVGAICMVCIPSDSSAPFVLSFLMPHAIVDTGTEDAPQGTATEKGSQQKHPTDATFAGGRVQAQPGDMVMKTRDGNFVILHRGGVLQLGSTEICQRIFIPLNNLMMDVSGNYAHHNTSGSILWGLQEGLADNSLPSLFTHTFRVRADDAEADVRVRVGEVRSNIGEPSGEDGDQSDLDGYQIGNDQKKDPIIYEVAVARKGFVGGTGDPAAADTYKNTVLRFFFDRKGGTFLRCKGSLVISTKSRLKIKAKEDITVEGKSLDIVLTNGAQLDGGPSTHIKGDLIRIGQGAAPIARQGDVVTVVFTPGIIPVTGTVGGTGSASGSPVSGFIAGGQIYGTITSGNSAVLG